MEFRTYVHESREENLRAAKRAVRANRRTIMMRHTGQEADVIDIMSGRDIIERHVCRKDGPYPNGLRSTETHETYADGPHSTGAHETYAEWTHSAGAYPDGTYRSRTRRLFVEGLALYQ